MTRECVMLPLIPRVRLEIVSIIVRTYLHMNNIIIGDFFLGEIDRGLKRI